MFDLLGSGVVGHIQLAATYMRSALHGIFASRSTYYSLLC